MLKCEMKGNEKCDNVKGKLKYNKNHCRHKTPPLTLSQVIGSGK